ncbi:MAG: hypothetical protein ABIO39_01700 [Caulobacteraceae bacterium]
MLAVLGLRATGFTPHAADSPATMEITIFPMTSLQVQSARAKPSPQVAKARPVDTPAAVAAAPAPVTPSSAPPAQAAATPAGGGEGPGCEREVLLLLTPVERERCRNQIAAETERRARAGQATRDADIVREARVQPKVDLIPQEKRVYYDAVQASRKGMRAGEDFAKLGAIQAARGGDGRASHNTKIDINVAFPKCSIKFGPNKEKAKKARGLIKLGPLPCTYQVQRGPLTEDAGTSDP